MTIITFFHFTVGEESLTSLFYRHAVTRIIYAKRECGKKSDFRFLDGGGDRENAILKTRKTIVSRTQIVTKLVLCS